MRAGLIWLDGYDRPTWWSRRESNPGLLRLNEAFYVRSSPWTVSRPRRLRWTARPAGL